MNRYIDSYGMLLENWSDDQGRRDGLWRTALLDICQGTTSTDECYYRGRVFRHPSFIYDWLADRYYNDCSQDQLVMDYCARIINKAPLPYIRRRFSDKFKQTFDFRWWLKGAKGSKFHAWLFLTFWRIVLPVLFTWNDLLWWYAPKTKISINNNDGKKNIYWRLRYPFYSFHLLSWMIYVLPNSKAKRQLNEYCAEWIWINDISNLLLLSLHGRWFPLENFYIKPQTDFRWQRRLNRLPPGIKLRKYNGLYQTDIDILKTA